MNLNKQNKKANIYIVTKVNFEIWEPYKPIFSIESNKNNHSLNKSFCNHCFLVDTQLLLIINS